MVRHRMFPGIAIVGGIVVAGGLLSATIPDSAGTVHTCYTKSTGTIRVIDNSVTGCKQGETSLRWNVQGPMGPGGPQGLEGPAGPPGAPGAPGEPGKDSILTARAYPAAPENSVSVPGLGTVTARCNTDGSAEVVVNSAVGTLAYHRLSSGFGFFGSAFTFNPEDVDTIWLRPLDGSAVWKLDYLRFKHFVVLPDPQGNPRPPIQCTAAVSITTIDPA